MADLFSGVAPAARDADADPFSGVQGNPAVSPVDPGTPIKTLMTAVATADPTVPLSTQVTEQGIATAKQMLDTLGEGRVRAQVAANQQASQMKALYQLKSPIGVDPGVAAQADKAYQNAASANLEDMSRTSLESETAHRVQDLLTQGNSVEAKVTYDLLNRGGAEAIQHEYAVKNFILAQKAEALSKQTDNQSWLGATGNFLLNLIPGNQNFSEAGVVSGASDGPMNWLLSGEGMTEQGKTLWNMPLKDFSKYMESGGAFDQSLMSNSTTIGLFDPGLAGSTLKGLTYQSDSDRRWADGWGVVGPASVLPWTKIGSVSGALVRLGARSAAVAKVADGVEAVSREGVAAGTTRVGLTAEDLADNLSVSAVDPSASSPHAVPLAIDVAQHQAAVEAALSKIPEIIQATRVSNPEELAVAFQKTLEATQEQIGNPFKDVQFKFDNLQSGEQIPFHGSIPEQGNVIPYVEVTFGKKAGGGYATERTVTNAVSNLGVKGEAFQDVSGQWFYKYRVNVPETGFYTPDLNPPTQSFLGRFIRSAARISDPILHGKAITSGGSHAVLQKHINTEMLSDFKKLSNSERNNLRQVLVKGTNEGKWYSDHEVSALYKRNTGKDIPEKTLDAYRKFHVYNDVDWRLRNDEIYKNKAIRGVQTTEFNLYKNGKGAQKTNAMIDYSPTTVPKERVFDISTGTHYVHGINELTADKLKELSGKGYVLAHLEDPVDLADGTTVSKLLAKKSDIVVSPLERKQLAYSEGGHRAYKPYGHYVKQADFGTQADTGTEFLRNPNVFAYADTPAAGRAWARTMEEARLYAKDGGVDPQHIDDNIFRGRPGFMTGQQFLDAIENKVINTKYPFESVFDREMPSAYTDRPDISAFVNEQETGYNGYYRTTGQMYTSGKGAALKDTLGEFAPTVDPYEMLSTSLYNISRLSSLSNYKTVAIDKFLKTFKNDLNIKDLADDLKTSPVSIFNSATVKRGVSITRQGQIEGQRAAIQRVLGFATPFDTTVEQLTRDTADWVIGDATDGVRKIGHDAIYWVKDHNPVNFLRGLAFDAKLGFFNVGQLFIQSSTMFAATALSPKFGMRGMMGAPGLMGYLISKGSENVLDTLAKRGVDKLMGFESESEFKNFARMFYKSGQATLDGTHQMVGDFGPKSVFGSFGDKVGKVREAGRAFFYGAEQMNRIVAFRIGYGESVEKGLVPGTAAFRENTIRLMSDYSFNMDQASSAWWQKGVLSIPTQFWAYNARMMGAMFGDRFTTAQKLRLVTSQLLIAGTAGVPVVDALADYLKQRHGISPDINTLMGTLDRGLLDKAANAITGADVQIGSKIGTGNWLTQTVKDVFNLSEYGEKSTAEELGGATYSISAAAGATLADVAKYAMAETGGDTGMPLTRDTVLKLASQISTLGNGLKAMTAFNYGTSISNNGAIQANALPSEDAFFMALGFQPQENKDLSYQLQYLKNKQDAVKQASRQLINWREEAFSNPDKRQDNMMMANEFVKLLPPDIKNEVLKKANKDSSNSLYESVSRQYQRDQLLSAGQAQENPK